MKRKRNFFIAGVLVFLAGFFAHFAWFHYTESFSVIAIIIASVLFMTSVVVFALNFRE